MAGAPQADSEEDHSDYNNEVEKIEADKELWEEIQEAIQANKDASNLNATPIISLPNIPEEYIINFVKEKLRSGPCKNQGYVLDGFPVTPEQAAQLFKGIKENLISCFSVLNQPL